MPEELKVPQTGYEDTIATLVEWLKEEGFDATQIKLV